MVAAQWKVGELQLEVEILLALLEQKASPPSPRTLEVSAELRAPLLTVMRVAGLSSRQRGSSPAAGASAGVELAARRHPGPVGAVPTVELLAEIRRDPGQSPFVVNVRRCGRSTSC
jgi:hypothetical protein